MNKGGLEICFYMRGSDGLNLEKSKCQGRRGAAPFLLGQFELVLCQRQCLITKGQEKLSFQGLDKVIIYDCIVLYHYNIMYCIYIYTAYNAHHLYHGFR